MNELETNNSLFENIKHIDEYGNEYWYARELQKVLNYTEWRKFKGVIDKAMITCNQSRITVSEQFVEVAKPIKGGNGNIQNVKDYKLSRYACYLIAQNGDSRKKVIALAQTYFAIQTRRQELSELEYEKMTEDEKRFYQRNRTKKGNYSLNQIAKKIVQTESKLKKDNIVGEYNVYKVGKKVRKTIKELGGTMPEDIPKPKKSLKELEKENKLTK